MDEQRITYFVDVLLPLALPETYTYRVPYAMNSQIAVGQRVVVQFGKKRIYSAIVKKIHQKAPDFPSVKYILDIIDNQPVVDEKQMRFWEWIAEYYMATEGEVMNAALPTAMKLASETRILLNPDFKGDLNSLSDKEFLIFEALEKNTVLTLTEVSAIVELKQVVGLLKSMLAKGVILEEEEMREKFVPRKETYIYLNEIYIDKEEINGLMDALEKRAPAQLNLLLGYIQLSDFFGKELLPVSKKALMHRSNGSEAAFKALVDKKVFNAESIIVSRLSQSPKTQKAETIILSEKQNEVLQSIREKFKDVPVQLFHGVTGSGKTEIYMRHISEMISQGKQVLYLLPEIALTGQIINRLQRFFGGRVGVYHSKYSQNERVEVWNKQLSETDSFDIIVGARSAIFLPYKRLGLVIVDEEHDSSFKQFDPAPRYHGRDAAIYLAMIHKANCLLGSATPSIETYYKAQTGKYGFTELKERYHDVQLPDIKLVNTVEANKNKAMKSHFSTELLDAVGEALKKREQVILFRNRRGFSLRVVCDSCQWSPECKNCDVTLTYHKHVQMLKCHYCGYSISVPERCPACGGKKLRLSGYGTEKVETELPIFFPEANIARMDLDTTRGKESYMQIIRDFEEKRVDILVGTQMVSKGLDFDNVGLVGVLNADSLISFPDFRSAEKSYQMLTQVSGRAGRKNQQGKVIIQTAMPENAVIQDVIHHDYEALYYRIIKDRETFRYPPLYRLIRISVKHKMSPLLNEVSQLFANKLREKLGDRVIGPEYPLVGRIKNLFIKDIIIKFEQDASRKFVKDFIRTCIEDIHKNTDYRQVQFHVDVDPY